MDIESWTSEGMDWSSVESVRAMPMPPCFEALRKACAERLLAALNAELMASGASSPASSSTLERQDVYAGLFAPSREIEAMPTSLFCSLFEAAMDYLLQSRFLDAAALGASGAEPLTASGIEASASSGLPFEEFPAIDEERALELTGAERRIEAAPLTPLSDWAYQQYSLLNLLRCATLYAPETELPGGQRYFVELTPWDGANGSYANLALGWAGLANFSVADFEAQGWNYKVATSGGKASAFGSADMISGWTRRQAWREWSAKRFDFGFLKAAGLAFELTAMQAWTEASNGLNEALPRVSTEFSTELFPRAGYSALNLASQPDENGLLEISVGDLDALPEIPSAPGAGSKVKGWSLKALGPFATSYAFKFKA